MAKLMFHQFIVPFIRKEVLVATTARSIYDHLSLEATLTERCIVIPGWSLLLIYISNPHCVVMGRHQNPWLESSAIKTRNDHVAVARRISGGGTVYHDTGNVNFSIISDRTDYNRQRNLDLLVSSLQRCGVAKESLSTTNMFDVLLSGHKISGTAARLDKATSLHHFTCLVNSNINNVNSYLEPTFNADQVVSSRATPSRVARIANATATESKVGFEFSTDILINNFINLFLEVSPETNNHFPNSCCTSTLCTAQDILNHDPTLIADYERRRVEYRTWDWIYGKTPPFVIKHSIDSIAGVFELELTVENGCIAGLKMTKSPQSTFPQENLKECEDMLLYLKELPLRVDDIHAVIEEAAMLKISQFHCNVFENTLTFLLSISTSDINHC